MNVTKLKAIIVFTAAILLSSSLNIMSQSKSITLDDAIDIAIKNNYTLEQARLNIERAGAKKDEALGNALPSLNINANYTSNLIKPKFFLPNFSNPQSKELIPIEIGANNAFSASAQINQIIFNSAVFTGIGTAKIFYDASKERYKAQLMQTVTDVKKTYYSSLLAREFLKVMETVQANSIKNLSNVESLYKEGFIPEFDLIRARVAVQNIEPEVMTAKSNYINLLNLLKLNLGINVQDNIELAGEITEPANIRYNADSIFKQLKDINYNLKSLEMAVNVNEELVEIYRSEYYPTISVFGNYAYQGQANDLNFNVVKSSAVGVNFSLNLFQGFQSQNRMQQAKIDYLTTKENYTQVFESLKMAINNAIYKNEIANEKVKSLQSNVEQAKRGWEIATIRYKEGIGNQVEINDANTAFSQANLAYLKAIYDLIDSQIDIENITGSIPAKYINLNNK